MAHVARIPPGTGVEPTLLPWRSPRSRGSPKRCPRLLSFCLCPSIGPEVFAGVRFVSESLAIDEPSLDAPPVYRRFLSGGSESLWPGRFSLLVLLLAGMGLLGVAWLFVLPNGSIAGVAFLWNGVGALVCSVVLVLMTSRWIGSRLGLLAGFVWLSSAAVLCAQVDTWPSAIGCSAMGWFAVAQVPGRLPTRTHPVVCWAFHATVGLSFLLFGPAAAFSILSVCLVFILISQDTRAVRFFVNPVALAILAVAALGRWLIGLPMLDGHEAVWLDATAVSARWDFCIGAMSTRLAAVATGALPWLPLALVAVVVGLRQGHYATPFWRFLGCWILVSVGWIILGAGSGAAALALVMPPMCILAAAGLAQTSVPISLALNRTRDQSRAAHRP